MVSTKASAKRHVFSISSACSLAGMSLVHHVRHRAPYAPVLEQIDIPVAAPLAAHGRLRIGFVADTHIGPAVEAADVARALALLADARPDILLLGGDYICESPRHAENAAAAFGDFASSVPLGACAVLGNHDYSCDAVRVANTLERRGIRVLRNDAARVTSEAGSMWIVGIDDAILGAPDVPRSFAGIPANAAILALWHEPDWASATAGHGAHLQLSGHSHGGQVRLPILGALAAPSGGRRYVSGLYNASGMPVYTSRGIGVYRPPVRFRCPPEVTLIRFKPESPT